MAGRIISLYLFIFIIFFSSPASELPADTLHTEEGDTADVRVPAVIEEFTLAVGLYEKGEYSLAFDQFRSVIELYPATPQGVESRYYLGMIYRMMRQDENARMTLQTFALTYPDHERAPDAWWIVSEIHTANGRHEEAGLALERLLQFHPNHEMVPRALLKASNSFERAGDREKAKRRLEQIILNHPVSDVMLDARLILGRYHLDEEQYAGAAALFRRIIAEIPERINDPSLTENRAEALHGLAVSYHKQRYFEQAALEYTRVMEQYQATAAYPLAVAGRAELYQELGRHLEAVDLFRRTQQIVNENPSDQARSAAKRGLLGIAESYNAIGDYSSAATFFDLYARQYAHTAPPEELVSVWYGAAKSNEGMRNYRQSVEWWNRIISTDARENIREKAYIRSAMNYIEIGRYEDAARRIRSYSEQFSTGQTAEALYRLGLLYEERLDDWRAALSAYEELAYRFPESGFIDNALYGQARIQLKLGNDRNAYHITEDFPRRFPGSTLLPGVMNLRNTLEIHHLQDRDGGFQSIAMLMSEMIAGAPRGELALQLGDIYLDKLKQYPEAARQFGTALSMDLPREKQNLAEYRYAYSLYRQAQISDSRRSESLAKLHELKNRSERSPNRESIAYYYLETLAAIAPHNEFNKAAEEFISAFPRSQHAVSVRMMTAEKYEESGDHESAGNIYRLIIRNHQNSSHAGEALYRLALRHMEAGEKDEAAALLSNYARSHPDGNRIADITLQSAGLKMEAGLYRDAIDLYSSFMRRFPYHDRIGEAKRNLAACNLFESRNREALALLDEILNYYHNSHFTEIPESEYEEILYFAGIAAYRNGQNDRAVDIFERYIVNDKSSERAGIASTIAGELYRQAGLIQSAEYYTGVSKRLINEGIPNKDIAGLLFINGQYERAIPHLLAVASSSESAEAALIYRKRHIVSLIRNGNADEARRRIEAFRTDYPRERDTLVEFDFETAMQIFRRRSYDAAARSFQQFIQQNQRHSKAAYAHFYLGRTWEAVGRLSDAKRKYQEILEKHPESGVVPDVHLAFGGLLLREGEFIEAIDHYRAVTETAGDDNDLMYYAIQNLAQAYEEIGFFDAALDLIHKFTERFPHDESNTDKQVKIGTLYQHARRYERSIEVFQSMILYADRPLETELRFYTGDSYHMTGNFNRAIREFRAVVEIDPRATQLDWSATALYMAGQSYEQMGDNTSAIAMYQEIINRREIDGQYKAAARREIERVRAAMRQQNQ